MSNLTVRGNPSGTGTVILEAPNTNSNRTITLPDSTSTLATTADVAAIATGPTLGTAVASTSGTAIDFTGIPSTAKRVTVMLSGVSFNNNPLQLILRLGTSTGIDLTSDYATAVGAILGTSTIGDNGVSTVFLLSASSGSFTAATLFSGAATLVKLSGNTWTISGTMITLNGIAGVHSFSGVKSLSADLDRVRIFPNAGVNFDAGTINISWE